MSGLVNKSRTQRERFHINLADTTQKSGCYSKKCRHTVLTKAPWDKEGDNQSSPNQGLCIPCLLHGQL